MAMSVLSVEKECNPVLTSDALQLKKREVLRRLNMHAEDVDSRCILRGIRFVGSLPQLLQSTSALRCTRYGLLNGDWKVSVFRSELQRLVDNRKLGVRRAARQAELDWFSEVVFTDPSQLFDPFHCFAIAIESVRAADSHRDIYREQQGANGSNSLYPSRHGVADIDGANDRQKNESNQNSERDAYTIRQCDWPADFVGNAQDAPLFNKLCSGWYAKAMGRMPDAH